MMLTENIFPIIAYTPLPRALETPVHNGGETSKEIVDELANKLKEAGFNLAIYGGSFQMMDACIKAFDKADVGIKSILGPSYLYDSLVHAKRVIDYYNNSAIKDSVVGWQIMDRPKFYDWGNAFCKSNVAVNAWNNLTDGYTFAKGYDPEPRTCFFNLAAPNIENNPLQNNIDIGSCKNYAEYLEALHLLYNPELWSFIISPFIKYPGKATEVLSDYFFRYLELFRYQSQKNGIPFWAYCMCQSNSAYDSNGDLLRSLPEPTSGMLRFIAFSALAFGAQGIVYSRVGIDRDSSDGLVRYDNAPILSNSNDSGIITGEGIYDAIKMVNSEIQKYREVFLGCSVNEISHVRVSFAGQPLFSGTKACISNVKCGPSGLLFSSISKNGKNYIVLVNQDPFAKATVEFVIVSGNKGKILTDEPNTNFSYAPSISGVEIAKSSQNFKRELEEGGYIIIEYEPWDGIGELDPDITGFTE